MIYHKLFFPEQCQEAQILTVISRSPVKKEYWDQKSWLGTQINQTKSGACLQQSTTLYRMDPTVVQNFCSVLFAFSPPQRQRVKFSFSSPLELYYHWFVCDSFFVFCIYSPSSPYLTPFPIGNCWILFHLHLQLVCMYFKLCKRYCYLFHLFPEAPRFLHVPKLPCKHTIWCFRSYCHLDNSAHPFSLERVPRLRSGCIVVRSILWSAGKGLFGIHVKKQSRWVRVCTYIIYIQFK